MKILTIFGTRPEAIKMLPVIQGFRKEKNVEVRVCITAQHRELLDQVLGIFKVKPDYDLNIMTVRQTLAQVTCKILEKIDHVLDEFKPEWVFVQGDTTTAFAASLAAFYKKISVAHIEAGLRTNNIYSPWPEEINRQLISRVAGLHFAPTESSRSNLLKEAVPEANICVTGNTVIDALLAAVSYIKSNPEIKSSLKKRFCFLDLNKKIILVTCHRRENFGVKMECICRAILSLSERSDLQIVCPVHPNPDVKEAVCRILSQKKNIYLLSPLDYLSFIYIMEKSYFILTDSGGVQEEASSFGKPIIVMRDTTERPEGVQIGISILVGSNTDNILSVSKALLDDGDLYRKMANISNPYGDGRAVERIVEKIMRGNV